MDTEFEIFTKPCSRCNKDYDVKFLIEEPNVHYPMDFDPDEGGRLDNDICDDCIDEMFEDDCYDTISDY